MATKSFRPITHAKPIRPRVKVWLEVDDHYVFGFGISQILKEIDRLGSIKGAAEALGKSYRHVWSRLKEAEQALGCDLVAARVGGKGASRSALTDAARQLVDDYDALRARMFAVVEKEFQSQFS